MACTGGTSARPFIFSARPTPRFWNGWHSPIVYREDEAVLARWRNLIPKYYRSGAVGRACRGMARSVAEQNLTDEPIPHKAYLYVLRALLAVHWIEQEHGRVAQRSLPHGTRPFFASVLIPSCIGSLPRISFKAKTRPCILFSEETYCLCPPKIFH